MTYKATTTLFSGTSRKESGTLGHRATSVLRFYSTMPAITYCKRFPAGFSSTTMANPAILRWR